MADASGNQQRLITFAFAGHFGEHVGQSRPGDLRINRGPAGAIIAMPGAIESPGKQLFEFRIG